MTQHSVACDGSCASTLRCRIGTFEIWHFCGGECQIYGLVNQQFCPQDEGSRFL